MRLTDSPPSHHFSYPRSPYPRTQCFSFSAVCGENGQIIGCASSAGITVWEILHPSLNPSQDTDLIPMISWFRNSVSWELGECIIFCTWGLAKRKLYTVKFNTTTTKQRDVYLHVVTYGGEKYGLIELDEQKDSIEIEYWSVFQSPLATVFSSISSVSANTSCTCRRMVHIK